MSLSLPTSTNEYESLCVEFRRRDKVFRIKLCGIRRCNVCLEDQVLLSKVETMPHAEHTSVGCPDAHDVDSRRSCSFESRLLWIVHQCDVVRAQVI